MLSTSRPIYLIHLPPSLWQCPHWPTTRLAMLEQPSILSSPSSSLLLCESSPISPASGSPALSGVCGSAVTASVPSTASSKSFLAILSSTSLCSFVMSMPSRGMRMQSRLALYSPGFGVPSSSSNLYKLRSRLQMWYGLDQVGSSSV